MRELQFKEYRNYIPQIQSAEMNTIFALSVLEGKSSGKVYVEEREDGTKETIFTYIINSCGMSLLYSDKCEEIRFEVLKQYLLNVNGDRKTHEFLQVYPSSLADSIECILGEKLVKVDPDIPYKPVEGDTKIVVGLQRVNYKFHLTHHQSLLSKQENKNLHMIRTSEDIYNNLVGIVIPKFFWKDYNDFVRNGVGFTALSDEGQPLSTAFSAFVVGKCMEIGIETVIGNRTAGFATAVCIAIIDYCMNNGYEPVWSCSSTNLGSRHLAEKLGFREVGRFPYYRLPATID